MNVLQHERIARIKQFSRYLYVCLTWIRYFLWVVWPVVAVVFLLGNKSNITIGVIQFDAVELTIAQRVLMIAVVSVFMFFALKLIYQFRELIRYFSAGDIFNKQAIGHARKALLNGLVIYFLYLCILFGSWIYSVTISVPTTISLNGDFILGLMFFGLMYVLLWALEIGCDLNEESELTI